MAKLLQRLGRWSAAHPWRVILGWIAALLVAATAFLIGFKGLDNSFDIPGLASSKVADELQTELPDFAGASGTIVFQREDGEALDDAQREAISALVAEAADLPDVARVVDPFLTEAARADQIAELAAGRAQLDAGRAQLEDGLAQLDAARAELAGAQLQLDAGRAQLETSIAELETAGAGEATLAALRTQLAELDGEQAGIDAAALQLVDGQEELDARLAELDAAATQAALGERLLELAEPIRVVSEDGSAAIATIAFTETRLELADESKAAVAAHFADAELDGIEVGVSTEISQGLPAILGPGELIGLLIAALVLGVMLRALVGALIPLAIAVTGVGVSMLLAVAFAGIVPMATATPVLGVMLGLAVGIDYSLFIINRHRKQLTAGTDMPTSIGLANGTAGNAVVFAGATVVVALLALNVTGIPFLGVMGNVGAVAILVAVLVAITLTPALLGLAGPRVLSRAQRQRLAQAEPVDAAPTAGLPATASSPTALRPMPWWRAIVTAVVAVALLVVIALPALSMRVGLPGGESETLGSLPQRAHAITQAQFGAGASGPILVTATLPEAVEDEAQLETQVELAEALAELDAVRAVVPIATNESGTILAFQLLPEDGPNAQSTADLVVALRAFAPGDGIEIGVTGQAAMNIDISERLLEALPVYLAVVVGLSLLIMIVVFRSLLVPVIATGGFILSLFATYGATVAVFQWGWGAELLGIHSTGPILNFLPIILIGILFGLAMDYQLFLATGMREAYTHGTPARLAVTRGFRAGRSVVVAAALIMVSIFGGFIFADTMIVSSLGFGLAVGILLDAFVVRVLLMPALMHLLGPAAWWLPRWLDRLLPNVDIEGASLERSR